MFASELGVLKFIGEKNIRIQLSHAFKMINVKTRCYCV